MESKGGRVALKGFECKLDTNSQTALEPCVCSVITCMHVRLMTREENHVIFSQLVLKNVIPSLVQMNPQSALASSTLLCLQ